MLKIKIPKFAVAEQRYVIDVVIREFLGLNFEIQEYDGLMIEISQLNHNKKLTTNTDFFTQSHRAWLQEETLPKLPLQTWEHELKESDIKEFPLNIPVLYGEPGLEKNDDHWHLNPDLFGSIFFMLSRYEELITKERDQHDRFPGTASIAFKGGFLDRPIVNEYTEILWACLISLWPTLKRKKRQFRKLISCDVDHPFDEIALSFKKTVLRVGARIFRDKNPKQAIIDGLNYFFTKFKSYKYDSYHNNIHWMMNTHPHHSAKLAFYFIPKKTESQYDHSPNISDEKVQKLLKTILKNGHEIGVHPGYNTYKSERDFVDSIVAFKSATNALIDSQNIGGRQHYLRYDSGYTPQLWAAQGLKYDSSLCFPDRPGFRCGVCYEFTMFDLINRVPLNLIQRPLIVMESLIISKSGFSEESLKKFKQFEKVCRNYDGDFTLLWHNSFFHSRHSKCFYLEISK